MIIRCPRCGKEVTFGNNPFRPFCSERCKLIDLGKWVSEQYRIATISPDEEEEGSSRSGDDSPKE